MMGFYGGFFVCLSCYWVLAKIIIYFIINDKGRLEATDFAIETLESLTLLYNPNVTLTIALS